MKTKRKNSIIHYNHLSAKEYHAYFKWDEDASVWVVTSNDIIGLILEDESLDNLIHKVQAAVPELLELNNQSPASQIKCSVESRKLVYS